MLLAGDVDCAGFGDYEGCTCVRASGIGTVVGVGSRDNNWRMVSTKYWRQSTEGYSYDSRLIGGGARDNKLDGDARRTRGFIQVRSPRWHNTYVLRLLWFVLMYDEMN
jgi:hypothetical protein